MNLKELILDTLKEEVVPALGCTEPIAIALACAKAKEVIEFKEVLNLVVLVSPNIYKNGLAVGLPNTNEVGLSLAAALGLFAGQSELELKVLHNIKEEDIDLAKKFVAKQKLSIEIVDTNEKVYIEANLFTDQGLAKVIIQEKHNKFVYIESNGRVLLKTDNATKNNSQNSNQLYQMKIRDIIKEVKKIPLADLVFMLEGLEMNERIAQEGLKKKTGIGVGYTLQENMKKGILSDDLMTQAMILTAAASDARMSGVNMPVMSSNGSGNNGITAILPILAYVKKFPVSEERLAQAIALSHLINSYIKHYIGRLSALCGCGVASGTGAAVAIAWLMGADYEQLDGVIKNMVANTSGMICDGAKVGCALKLATSASAAIQSALLAVNNRIVPANNGIVAESAEETIRNLGKLSVEGMSITDQVILNIMQKKMHSFV